MRPFDPGSDDPGDWRIAFNEWKAEVAAARAAQVAALRDLHAAETALSPLVAWRDQLAAVADAMAGRVGPYAAANAELAALAAALDALEGELADHLTARDTATARLVEGPPVAQPIALLPVRVHTAWLPQGLAVRVIPTDLSVDRHDPRLSPLEATLGQAYWATRSLGGQAQADQAWRDLANRVPPARAAWVVSATAPAAAPAGRRDDELDLTVTVRLLPTRFAVVLLASGEPVDVSSAGDPPAYVTWGAPLDRDLAVPVLHSAQDRPWTTDLDAAVEAGMAVRISLPANVTAVEEVVVVGVRAGTSGDDLARLLAAHAFSVGAEILPAGTATNNTASERTRRTEEWERALARSLLGAAGPLAVGTDGAALAAVLGVPAATFGLVGGSANPRDDLYDAVAELVAAAAGGTLISDLDDPGAAQAAAALRPAGPAPPLRVGKQPFGVLPTLDLSRYAAGPDDLERGLAPRVRTAARRQLVPLHVDPGDPERLPPPARRVTATDDSALPDLLGESAVSLRWSVTAFRRVPDAGQDVAGEPGLLGPAEGPGAPQTYLAALAAGTADAAAQAGAVESVLGALAVSVAAAPGGPALLDRLGAVLAGHGRPALATALAAQLDACSHRVDAWVTAAATHRLSAAAASPAVGAYGYATDLAPRRQPRSFGHIHAPSAAHAATAAVLRSGYLGQRRAAWAARLATALASGDAAGAAAARDGLTALAPLDDRTESRLPMAVDLSSGRVRRAQEVLTAVRAGTPLAVVLGRQFERALVVAGLSTYLAPLRKLTRFVAGTALESLEQARREAVAALGAVQATVDQLGAAAAEARAADQAAQAALAVAQAEYDAVATLFTPYAALDAERPQVQGALDAALTRIADLDANRPQAGTHKHPVNVP
ncbi:MAG TPA: hypothetical protein VFJ97_00995 [Dermatophilaceae bacterium]|nr:hypothetical protein [Dermatophilaceae bacterium]